MLGLPNYCLGTLHKLQTREGVIEMMVGCSQGGSRGRFVIIVRLIHSRKKLSLIKLSKQSPRVILMPMPKVRKKCTFANKQKVRAAWRGWDKKGERHADQEIREKEPMETIIIKFERLQEKKKADDGKGVGRIRKGRTRK
jgi:hypothetical protein